MSVFARKQSFPTDFTIAMASWMVAYWTEESSEDIPSLTDAPLGKDKWWIKLYSPGIFLGTTPRGDTWNVSKGGSENGPASLWAESSFSLSRGAFHLEKNPEISVGISIWEKVVQFFRMCWGARCLKGHQNGGRVNINVRWALGGWWRGNVDWFWWWLRRNVCYSSDFHLYEARFKQKLRVLQCYGADIHVFHRRV